MKALFGIVSLLIVLAIVGVLASRQMKAVVVVPQASGTSGTAQASSVADQSRQIQQQVRDDVAKALQQGAQRTEEADK